MSKITNEQKYKTIEERANAYFEYVTRVGKFNAVPPFKWLSLEVEDEKIEPCPFCEDEVEKVETPAGKKGDKDNGRRPPITFYGYAVKKDGKYLGYNPKRNKNGKFYKMQFYKSPMFPVVGALRETQEYNNGNLGEVVKVKLTMEEVPNGK